MQILIMDQITTFNLRSKKRTALLIAMLILWLGAMLSYVPKLGGSPIALSAVIAVWCYISCRLATQTTITISRGSNKIITRSCLLGISLRTKTKSISQYHSVRNRIHWGWLKQCNTELVSSSGAYLPLRIEWGTDKITSEAEEFKNKIMEISGLGDGRDIEHI